MIYNYIYVLYQDDMKYPRYCTYIWDPKMKRRLRYETMASRGVANLKPAAWDALFCQNWLLKRHHWFQKCQNLMLQQMVRFRNLS